tara:strand:+ start:70 stop:585 length:516 start_codon:yes stop_codon:yes gene_type:complete
MEEKKIEITEVEEVEENQLGLSVNLTQQQQKFVENVVYQDMSQTEAARKAGYSNPAVQAHRNMKSKNIMIAIDELRHEAQHRNNVTLDRSLRDLKSIRDAAVLDGSWGPAIKAEELRMKAVGLLIEKKAVLHGRVEALTKDEVLKELKKLQDKAKHQSGIELDKSGKLITN